MKDLNHTTVLVLGLGDSGLAMARWSARCGATVRVWDSREAPPQAATLRGELPDVAIASGALDAGALDGVQRVLKSPGLSPADARLAPLLAAAAARGIPVQGELDLFARALADLKAERGYAPKVLAITGTNGKTTTTSLTALLVERAGRRVAVAGNIGPTLLDTLAAALDLEPFSDAQAPQDGADEEDAPPLSEERGVAEQALAAGAEPLNADEAPARDAGVEEAAEGNGVTAGDEQAAPAEHPAPAEPDAALEIGGGGPPPHLIPPPPPGPVFAHLPEVWVLELSSFQLDGVQGFEPTAAAVLNLSQDHLDWHGSMPAYAAAKARIFGRDAVMVLNRDDAAVMAMAPEPAATQPARGRAPKPQPQPRRVVRFGLDAPRQPGDFGLLVEHGMAWLVRARESEDGPRRRKDEGEELVVQRLMPADALRIRGRHNAANAMAALALAGAAGCPMAPMLHGLREYRGEPHRVEYLATLGGVDFFDDSKGTNVGATVAALLGLGADRAPARLALILGGDGKGQDFAPLAEPLARHGRFAALIGRDAPALEAALAATGVPLARFDTLEAATRACAEAARPGDAVLLSPACASLDMFRNYAHRAEVFAATVQALQQEHGEIAP
ncbi:UDP-N-acetylmuramoyl-L-alanine--D-glutamate ligase [Caldimonas tepidiphila]|uniref:UDP-N-acetylmuramoyl-L-alanine--D-glutamate ligase n=1 Tax=Caldimonas tepidiphila TaxID=2315841 RepID=UPI000E5A668F|nr:UDP-N-acetylmuramoyl-L-alanine--D-glutamate ligase [Caldimonas tepidiphila]